MKKQILAAGLALAMVGGGGVTRGDDDTAQVLGSIFSGISGMIGAANSGGYGNSGYGQGGFGQRSAPYRVQPGSGWNQTNSGNNWNTYGWGGYSQPTYSPGYTTQPSYSQSHSTYYTPSYNIATNAPPAYQPSSYATAPAAIAAQIKISNPASNGLSLKYHLNGQLWEIPAGYEQKLERQYVIEFSRGTGFGNAKYQLTSGTYTFQPTERGWELYRRPIQ